MFIYASIRVDYGNDYAPYVNIYEEIQSYYSNETYKLKYEVGYVWLNYIMPSHRSLLVLLSAFTCYTYYFIFSRYVPSKYYWLGFVIMAISGDKMLFFQLSGLRNAVAINIMILALPFILNRKILPYLGLTFLAFLFHKSVIFFMPLAYFVASPSKFSRRDAILWSMITVFLFGVSSSILIDYISPYINIYFDKYNPYIDVAREEAHEKGILVYGYVISVLLLTFSIFKRTNLSKNETLILKLTLLFLVSLMLGKLNFRMSQYFAPYMLVGATIVMNRCKPKLKYLYLIAIFLFLVYSFFVVFMGSQYFAYDEYHTIF